MASFITIIAGLFLANVQGLLGAFFLFWGMTNEGSHALLVSSVGFLQDLDIAVRCSGSRCLDFCHTRSYQRLIMGATRGIFAFSGFLLLS